MSQMRRRSRLKLRQQGFSLLAWQLSRRMAPGGLVFNRGDILLLPLALKLLQRKACGLREIGTSFDVSEAASSTSFLATF